MYADYFLRFADQAEADAVLFTAHSETVDADGTVTAEASVTPNFQNIDVIGTLYQDDGEPFTGYHVNVRLVVDVESPDAIVPFMVTPEHPRRVWAGPMYPAAPPVLSE